MITTTRRDPRTETIAAFHRLIEPIPGITNEIFQHRRRSFFIFGGCLTWLIFGLFILAAYMLIITALVVYVGAIESVRLLIALGWLTWWGLWSGAGVLKRHNPRSAAQIP